MKKREWIIGLMLVATLGLAGCGDDSRWRRRARMPRIVRKKPPRMRPAPRKNTLEQADETAEEAGDSVEESTD